MNDDDVILPADTACAWAIFKDGDPKPHIVFLGWHVASAQLRNGERIAPLYTLAAAEALLRTRTP